MNSTGKPVIILGVDRSGTSLVAELVLRWGAWGGEPQDLERANRWNPRGYYENRRMVDVLVRLMQAAGVSFWHPDFAARLQEQTRNPEMRGMAEELVTSMARDGRVWFWKEPMLSVLLPFWREIWGDALYVVPVRNPYDSSRSWEKLIMPTELLDRVSILSANLLRWHCFMHSILTEIEATPRKIFIPYEKLLQSPREQCGRLAHFLGEHTGEGLLDQEERIAAMVEAVDPSLQNNRSSLPFRDVAEATGAQKNLYDLLVAKTEDAEIPYDPLRYPMYPGWREYLDNLQRFSSFYGRTAPLLGSPTLRTLAWTEVYARAILRLPRGWWRRRQASAAGRR